MDPSPINSQLLKPEKVAWVLDVGHSTVEEWTRRREIASFKKGKVRRYSSQDVLEFILRHTVKARNANGAIQLQEADWLRIERLIDAHLQSRRGGMENNGHLEAA